METPDRKPDIVTRMWALCNRTAYAADRNWTRDEHGVHWWVVAIRATFTVATDGKLSLSDEQLPPPLAPEHYGGPGESSLRYDSELLARKPSTDVIVLGSAHAPAGKPAPTVSVGLRIGSIDKTCSSTAIVSTTTPGAASRRRLRVRSPDSPFATNSRLADVTAQTQTRFVTASTSAIRSGGASLDATQPSPTLRPTQSSTRAAIQRRRVPQASDQSIGTDPCLPGAIRTRTRPRPSMRGCEPRSSARTRAPARSPGEGGTWIILEPPPWRAEEPESTFEEFLRSGEFNDQPDGRSSGKITRMAWDNEGCALLVDHAPIVVAPQEGREQLRSTEANPHGRLLWIRPNTHNLRCQKYALHSLDNFPVPPA